MTYDRLYQLIDELKNKLEFLEDEVKLMEQTADLQVASNQGAVGSYVYRHWDTNGSCIYIGSGTGDRAWSDRGRDEEYTVEIIADGLDRDTAYCVESAFIENYGEQHGGRTPKYNMAGREEYFKPQTFVPGPWQLCYFERDMPVAATTVFKSPVRNVIALLKSAMNNKMSYTEPWVAGLSSNDWDSVRIRFGEH